jgi:hypothetical protein
MSSITIQLDSAGTAGTDLALVTDHDGECHLVDAGRLAPWKQARAKLIGLIHVRHIEGMTSQDIHKSTLAWLQTHGMIARDDCAVLRMTGSEWATPPPLAPAPTQKSAGHVPSIGHDPFSLHVQNEAKARKCGMHPRQLITPQ